MNENITSYWEELMKKASGKSKPIDNERLIRRLCKPQGKVDVVLDTDTYNEIDDQYALAYLINSDEKLSLKAIYAAPFYNQKSTSPEDGMEKSFQEIENILNLMERKDLKEIVFRGSSSFLKDESQPVLSDAAKDLAQRAMSYSEESPLYVIAIGAITNVASALLLQPEIKNRMVVIWLGGNAFDWPHNIEFNLTQDVASARVVYGSGVPLVLLPCQGVVSSFRTSGPELEYHLRGKNKLCDYLIDVTTKEAKEYGGNSTWTRVIWDVTAVAWLLDGDFMDDRLEHTPIPEYDHYYSKDPRRHLCKYVYSINRDKLFEDLFLKLQK